MTFWLPRLMGLLGLLAALTLPLSSIAAPPNPKLTLPDFAALAQKASDSVTITLDAPLLAMAGRFLDSSDPQEAATQQLLKGLQGIYVRSYRFDEDAAYRAADIDAIRAQLSAPGWTRLVQTRSSKSHADVDIYLMTVDNQAVGLAVLASEARQFTIINIVGAIDLDKLRKLQGKFGIPRLDWDTQNPTAKKK